MRPAVIEEFVIWGRRRDFVTDAAFLKALADRGFEPQVVGEIDPPPKGGGSWVLRDRRDRRAHEDGGVWISWARPRGGESRDGFPVKYVVETFDGRSGWDWFLSCAVATAIATEAGGKVSTDGSADRDANAFLAEMKKDPATEFHGPESIVDWESEHLDEDEVEDEEDDLEDEDEYESAESDEEAEDEDEEEDEDVEDEEDDSDEYEDVEDE